MAISFPSGFSVTGKEAIDTRIVMTKEEMLNAKKARMPEVYFAICKDDGNIYVYNEANEPDEEFGRFRLYAADTDEDDSAPIDIALIQSLFKEEGTNENG